MSNDCCVYPANTPMDAVHNVLTGGDKVTKDSDCCPEKACAVLLDENGEPTGDVMPVFGINQESPEGKFAGVVYKDANGAVVTIGTAAGEYKIVDNCNC